LPVTKKKAPVTAFQNVAPLVGQSQKGPSLNQAVRNYFKISPANLKKYILKHIKPLPSNATPTMRQAKLKELFNLIRIGGKLGIQYQYSGKRKPKTPDEVLKPGKGMKADCDELAMLYVAAARQLNIGTKGISMGGFQFSTSKAGTSKTIGHAALFVSGAKKHIFDFTKGKIMPVTDFSNSTISKTYHGTRISYGRGQAGHPITGLSSMNTFGNVSDMAAAQLLLRADHYAKQAAKTSLENARILLANVAGLRSTNTFVKKGIVNVGLSVLDRYHGLGNKAYKGKRYSSAESFYKKALGVQKTVPALKKQRAKAEHDMNESLGLLYQKTGKSALALAQFSTLIKLRPKGWSGYRKKMNLEINLAKAALRRRDTTNAKKFLKQALSTAGQALKKLSSTSTHFAAIQKAQRQIAAYMKRRGWK
jgi:hypothetical protein